jgi:glycosyltransferase involved in cell wall biosynthesis
MEQLALQHGLRVSNNSVPSGQISGLYAQCGALIYPSLFESFGLPLLEARLAGVPILAAERDYVRDVITPAVSFDPESSLSIARAVMRYEGWGEEPPMPGDAASFLERLAESG